MAAEMVTPVDELTGLPLPLAPPDYLLPLNRYDEANWHHHAHPRRSPLLQGMAGIAVRNVRLQLAELGEHNKYHQNYFGPPLPETPEAQFSYTVMAAAGYVPPAAIEVNGRKPKIVSIDHEQRNRLWQSGELKVASLESVRKFLKDYVLAQDTSHLHENVIDEFLHTPDVERKQYLGNLLLAKVIERAVEPVDNPYRYAYREGLIPSAWPTKANSFVSSAIGRAKRRRQLVQEFHIRMEQRAS
jgi:hypothetical protein